MKSTNHKLRLTGALAVLATLALAVSCQGFFPKATLASLAVGPPAPTIDTGVTNNTVQMFAVGTFTGGGSGSVDVSWTISPNDGSIATITAGGLVTAATSGSATVTATANQNPSITGAQTITVNSNTAGTWSLTWGYDRLGNRKQQTLTGGNLPGGIGQPSFTIDETTNRINGFSYDSAGNLTGDGTFTYTYDGANRMKQAQQIASPNTITSSTYFGALRIKKVVGATTTRYLYSGSKPIAEYVNGSTTPSKEYIYAGSTLLATIAGTSTTYHHPDHLSNRAETDATGAVVRSAGHFPYGESWYESSSDPMKFTSYTRDSGTGESGLDYAMFRQYNSGQGRFMSADLMIGNPNSPESLNRYTYTNNDPINAADLLGLTPQLVTVCQYTPITVTTTEPNGTKHTTHTMALDFCISFMVDFGGGPYLGGIPGGLPPSADPLLQALKAATRNFKPTPPFVPKPGPYIPPYQGPPAPPVTSPTVPETAPTWLKVLNFIGAVANGLGDTLNDFMVCFTCNLQAPRNQGPSYY